MGNFEWVEDVAGSEGDNGIDNDDQAIDGF